MENKHADDETGNMYPFAKKMESRCPHLQWMGDEPLHAKVGNGHYWKDMSDSYCGHEMENGHLQVQKIWNGHPHVEIVENESFHDVENGHLCVKKIRNRHPH